MNTLVRCAEYQWYVQDDGPSDAPPLLLLHGFTGRVEFWDEVVAELAGRFHCVRIDLPGHGRTIAPPDPSAFTMPHVADALCGLLDHLQIARTHVWGYSLGGRLALHFAAAHPDRLHCLILESASPGIDDPSERAMRRADDERLAQQIECGGVPAFVEDWMRQPLFASQAPLPNEKQSRARNWRSGHTAAGLAAALRGLGVGAQEPLSATLPQLRIPTLILVGRHDAKFRAIGSTMVSHLPHASLHIVPEAGHAPHWEQPAHTAKIVAAFLSTGGGH
jgi:2-succinyl-6-hydroxy-2,4-cyclohexadiene-1-carboxylate synthase